MLKYISKEVVYNKLWKLIRFPKKSVWREFVTEKVTAGAVACVIVTKDNNIYTGVSVVMDCALGTCAERSAAYQMIKNNETEIQTILTIGRSSYIYPPCDACLGLIKLINPNNINTKF
ncbi:hypothetical protein [Mesoplasma melaleucae]|uniref:Cytidine deaminase n=1 Tax=Mesoplasma melaleucae TaxID=81459 RepID=A0A2K8NZU4_9MOLU|nr:hypothetical protein [Mesoplasma melaleucae]ATZ18163.1 cytidine deaminase [Mesoplasma melaleucae]